MLDSKTQCCDPEVCVNLRYKADSDGWAHAMQVMPDGDACYVGFRTAELPYALRWLCRTGDEDGIGVALPTTGTNHSTAYQKAHGLYNTIPPHAHHHLRFNFGYLAPGEAQNMTKHIGDILAET